MQQHRQRLDHLASSLEFRPSQIDLLKSTFFQLPQSVFAETLRSRIIVVLMRSSKKHDFKLDR